MEILKTVKLICVNFKPPLWANNQLKALTVLTFESKKLKEVLDKLGVLPDTLLIHCSVAK